MIPLPGFQNPMPYFALDRPEELVDLGVDVEREAEVDVGSGLGQDEVVAVDGRGDGDLGETGRHELQEGHLGGGVLHGHPVGAEVGVAAAPLHLLALGVDQVVDEDLLGQRQRPVRTDGRRWPTRSGRDA